jgi:DNA-binding Lrp family transcriptional regulator
MVTGIALINVAHGAVNSAAQALAALEGISEVYSVSGNYDLVAIIRVRDNDELAHLMTDEIGRVEGISETHTMLAFRAFSRHDLEAMFALGS